jgi:hypothetical protein
VATCGDFLDSTYKTEYIRRVLHDTHACAGTPVPFQSLIDSLLGAMFAAEKEDVVCACGKVGACNGKRAVLTVFGEFAECENGIDWALNYLEKELDKSSKSKSVTEVVSTFSVGLQALSHVHPSAFSASLGPIKNLLFVISNYVKFLSPFHGKPLPHMVTHPSFVVFVFLARVFGVMIKTQPKWATSVKVSNLN